MLDIKTRDGEKWDNVIYVVDNENWKSPAIGGWNLGSPINGFGVEIVRMYQNNPLWLFKTFSMEIAHSWNDLCIQEINDNLLALFDVKDFDNMVIHGQDSRYGVLRANGTYFTDYDYSKQIGIVKDTLKRAYDIRKARYEKSITPIAPAQFKFTKDLYFGLRNSDVVELQKRMKQEGLATYSPTGFFGWLTLASVKAYQKRNGISPLFGYCGIKTRTLLNSTVPAQPQPVEIEELDM